MISHGMNAQTAKHVRWCREMYTAIIPTPVVLQNVREILKWQKAVHEEKPKVQVKAPSWLFEDNKSETMSEEELKELENMFEEFR